MMSKERELLKKILSTGWLNHDLSCEVEELLAKPERDFIRDIQYLTDCLMESEEKVSKLLDKPEQEPLSDSSVIEYLGKQIFQHFSWDSGFKFGVKYAEKEHGIGE